MAAGLIGVSVAAADVQETTNRLTVIDLTLNADFDWQSFVNFLRALENSELSFSVKSVEVAPGPPQTLSVGLSVPFVQEERQ